MDNENSEVTSRSRAEFSGHQREEVNTFSGEVGAAHNDLGS